MKLPTIIKSSVIALSALVIATQATAEVERKAYFSVLGGVQDFHDSGDNNAPVLSNSLDESDVIAAELGFMLGSNWALQLSYNKMNPNEAPGFGDEDMIMQSLDLMHYFANDTDGGPYMRLGAGTYEFDDPNAGGGWVESDIIRAGFGVESAISDSFSWRGEIGVVRDTTYNRYDTQMLLGFTVSFGTPDSADIPDIQPAVKTEVQVNQRKDSDNDGVFDDLDQCPATSAGVVVDSRGCELDSDGDGVSNSKDACPATPVGAKVDATGCRVVLEETVRMTLDVKFKNNSSLLEAEFKSDIARLAKFMTEYPDTKVVVEGHSDSRGNDDYNKWLSERRAATVAKELVDVYNIPANRVSAKGFGETNPIASNATPEGRAKNRRVEAVIEATVSKPQ